MLAVLYLPEAHLYQTKIYFGLKVNYLGEITPKGSSADTVEPF